MPLQSGDSYNRLSLIKNLETVMTSLLRHLKEGIGREEQRSRKDELDGLSDTLLNLFDGYDALPQEQKRDRLSRATPLLSKLKTISAKRIDDGGGKRTKDRRRRRRGMPRMFSPGRSNSSRGSVRGSPHFSPEKTSPPSKTCSIFFHDGTRIVGRFPGLRKRFPGSGRPSWAESHRRIPVSTAEEESLR